MSEGDRWDNKTQEEWDEEFVNKTLRSIGNNNIRQQIVKDCDYYNKDGILICGICGEPRQEINFYQGNPKLSYKFTRECKCERDARIAAEEKRKQEERRQRIEWLKADSGLPKKLEKATFDTFQITKTNRENFEYCKNYAEKFKTMEQKNIGIIMTGKVGTGKSYAAACIANYLLDREVSVAVASTVHLLDSLRNPENETDSICKRLTDARLLILDDFGAERSTDYAVEKLYEIISSRYMAERPLIITTNLTLNDLEDKGDVRYERIFSRIAEHCYPMMFAGVDWRKRAAGLNHDKWKEILKGNDNQ